MLNKIYTKNRVAIGCCLLLFYLPLNAQNIECSNLAYTDFLLGQWQAKTGNGYTVESWERTSDSSRVGSGVTFSKNTDGASLKTPDFQESLQLVLMQDAIFYLAKTTQNKLPVAFQLAECSDELLIFENEIHDFPNKISYQKKSSDHIVVNVSDKAGKGFSLDYHRLSKAKGKHVINVRKYVDAYNQSDLLAMKKLMHDKIQWLTLSGKQLRLEVNGKNNLIDTMKKYFDSKTQSSSVTFLLQEYGDYVMGMEQAVWSQNDIEKSQCSPVIYEFEDSLIRRVFYFPEKKCEVNFSDKKSW